MALISSNIPGSQLADTKLPLCTALADFEQALNGHQRIQYHASSTIPDTSTIISFIRVLDETSQGKARAGVSSRLYTFLGAVQQFTKIVDTFVSSNPAVAALLWGGVKITILVASNVTSYFEKVTSLIMTIGKFCPTYQSFGQLYPGCVELQSALCEYYAVIIRLCINIVVVSQRTPTSQTFKSIFMPFESEFSEYITQLQEATRFVELQCKLASSKAAIEREQSAAAERKKSERYRSLGELFRSDLTKQQAEAREWRIRRTQRDTSQLRDAIHQSLSSIEPLKAFKHVLQKRVPNTAKWFQQDPAFVEWYSDRGKTILLCTGTMGMGKTVLMSSVVEFLHSSCGPMEVISYHFCSTDHTASIQARQVFGSIARQILDPWIQKAQLDELHALLGTISAADIEELTNILSARMYNNQLYIVVLDGLDECETKDIEVLIGNLATLCREHPNNLKLVVTSRPDIEKQLRRSLQIDCKMSLQSSKTKSDIESYIEATLDKCLEDGKLCLTDPKIVLKIMDKLDREAHGMFLWVQLFISDLCDHNNDLEILRSLSSPSPSISQLINDKIERIQQKGSAKDIMKLLQFCGVTKRPLTTYEYQELLGLNINQRSLDASLLIHDVARVVAGTGGLMYIDEEEDTIHYVHHSIRSHLFQGVGQRLESFEEIQLDLHLGYLSLTYLDFNDFKRGLTRTGLDQIPGQNRSIRPIDLGAGALSYSVNTTTKWAQKLLRNQNQLRNVSGKELESKIQDIIGTVVCPSSDLESEYRFLKYARTHWLDHLVYIPLDWNNRMWNLFHGLVTGQNNLVDTPWKDPVTKSGGWDVCLRRFPVVGWALSNGKSALLNHELRYRMALIDPSTQQAILNGVDRRHLRYMMTIMVQQKTYDTEALYAGFVRAAALGITSCVDLCLRLYSGPDLDAVGSCGYTVLFAAAVGGHLEVVERLLAAGANVNATKFNLPNGPTALQAAAGEGHFEIVEKLLEAKADVNFNSYNSYYGRTPLQAAARRGHLDIVERLLVAGADVNAAPGLEKGRYGPSYEPPLGDLNTNAKTATVSGRTALQAAAEGGHIDVVESLLTAGADLNAIPDSYCGLTALQAAASGGHLETVVRLLDVGADVNAGPADVDGRTTLEAAAEGGYLEIVVRLLDAGADVNATFPYSYHYLTALQAAAVGGHFDVAAKLIQAGADINAAPALGVYRKTLQAAAREGYFDVVERILAKKADTDAADAKRDGQKALQAVVDAGHDGVAVRLRLAQRLNSFKKS